MRPNGLTTAPQNSLCSKARVLCPPARAAGAAAGDTAAGLDVSDSSVDTTLSAALPLSAAALLPLLLTSAVSALMAVVDAATSAGCACSRLRF